RPTTLLCRRAACASTPPLRRRPGDAGSPLPTRMAMASSCRPPARDARWPRRPPRAKAIATCRTRSIDRLPAQERRSVALDRLEVRYQDVAAHLLDPDLVEGRRLEDLRRDLRVPRAAGNLYQGGDLVLGNIGLQAVQRAE